MPQGVGREESVARYRKHNHYCAAKGCKNVIATCSAPQDDGSPHCCEDEEHFHWTLCDDCEEVRSAAEEADRHQDLIEAA